MSDNLQPAPHAPPPDEEGWQELLAVLDRVPFLAGLKRDVASLGRLVAQRRPPRIMALGSTGSGRSQLANALLGASVLRVGNDGDAPEGRWVDIDAGGRRLDWVEVSVGPHALDHARLAAEMRRPDVILLVATPDEAQAGLGHHLEALTSILGHLDDAHGRPTPISILTQVDTLPPANAAAPFPQAKQMAIEVARQSFVRQLGEASLPTHLHVVATTTPAEHRLGIDHVGIAPVAEAIADVLPEAARVEGVRTLPGAIAARRRVASGLVRSCSTLAITVAITPFPLSDIVVLAPLQGMMVTTLAYLSGREWDRKTAGEWITSVGLVGGAGIGMRWGAQQIVKLVPGMGSIVSAGIAGAGTLALGRSALRYFLDQELEE